MKELRNQKKDEEQPKISSSKKLPLLQGLEGQREREVQPSSRGWDGLPSEAEMTQAVEIGAETTKRSAL